MLNRSQMLQQSGTVDARPPYARARNTVVAAAMLAGAAAAYAICPADTGGAFRVTTPETCTAALASYTLGGGGTATVVLPAVAGATINLSAADVAVTYTGAANSYGIGAETGAVLNAAGNVTATARGANSRAVYITGGTVDIQGNLSAARTTRVGGASIELASNNAMLTVRGTTAVPAAAADGLRNAGTAHFVGAVTIDASSYPQGVANTGTSTFDGNLTVNPTNMGAGLNVTAGRVDVAGNLAVAALLGADSYAGTGVTQTAGVVSVDGTATITTVRAGGHGIAISGGTFESGGTASASAGPSVLLGAGSSVSTTGANAAGLRLASASAANVIHNGTISSALGDGIDASGATGGATIKSSGRITATAAGMSVVRGSPAADNFTADAGALAGITLMGAGDDTATLTGAVDISAAPQFDGGAGVDALNIDGFSLRGFTAAANNPAQGGNLTLWETIDVKNAGSLVLTGDLFAADNLGTLRVSDAGSALDLQNAATAISTVHGNLASAGLLKLDTVLGDSSSASDVLRITGDTSGTAVLHINNLNGAGAATTGNGILVVQVGGDSAGAFTLANGSVTAGQYAYTLKQVGSDWYLQSAVAPPTSGGGGGAVVPVPSLGAWATGLLGMLLAGMAGVLGRGRRVLGAR